MKHALRTLAREKAFTSFAILTSALDIGAVTTIYSVVNSVLFEAAGLRRPGRLYAATESAPQLAQTFPRLPVNAAHFRGRQQQCQPCLAGAERGCSEPDGGSPCPGF